MGRRSPNSFSTSCSAMSTGWKSMYAKPLALCLALAASVFAKEPTTTPLAGLKQPVEILRDRWGVPHIYAKNTEDLFFAQGFVAAQDRLFQIDLWRRVAVGETAEVVGK